MMFDYSGDDLLSVFSDLNILLLNISPNVVKAWFDTDDKDMKNLLTWMCTSLSKKNYMSPLENKEFLELETPLFDEKYAKEYSKIGTEYPGLFDVDSNTLEAEFIEDEIELMLKEEKQIDDVIKMNEILQSDLSTELAYQTSREIETSLKVNSAQGMCNTLGEKLDDVNGKLYAQLEKYGSNLYNFEFASIPNFMSNMNINECQENFESVASFLVPALEGQFLPANITGLENRTYLDSINPNDSVANSLNTMRSRILHSHQSYLVSKIEAEKLREILTYLNKVSIESIMSLSESIYVQMSRDNKEETKRRMCSMLDNISAKLADHYISQAKFKYAQQELELHQIKLNTVKTIETTLRKCLCQYFLLSMLFVQEKQDIDSSDKFFRKILHYINKDLQYCALRMEKMQQIIHQYEDYTSKTIGEKYKMITSIIKIVSDKEDFNLNNALEVVSEFKNELCRLESKLFCSDFNDYRVMSENLRNNISLLQSFLICGPTHKVVVIPSELQHAFQEIEDHMQKQVVSVKSALEISTNMKKIVPNKWQNYRRQLWMYFYTNPEKLRFIIKQVEDEFKKQKVSNVSVW